MRHAARLGLIAAEPAAKSKRRKARQESSQIFFWPRAKFGAGFPLYSKGTKRISQLLINWTDDAAGLRDKTNDTS